MSGVEKGKGELAVSQAVDDVDVGREDLMLSCPCVMPSPLPASGPEKGKENTHDEEGLYGCMAGLYP